MITNNEILPMTVISLNIGLMDTTSEQNEELLECLKGKITELFPLGVRLWISKDEFIGFSPDDVSNDPKLSKLPPNILDLFTFLTCLNKMLPIFKENQKKLYEEFYIKPISDLNKILHIEVL